MTTQAILDSTVRWHGVADAKALRQAAYRRIVDSAADAIKQRGRFLIVLAGGSTPRNIYQVLRAANTDWSRWRVYFGDERCVPMSHIERNSRMAADAWLNHVAIVQSHIHVIPAELGATAATAAYAEILRDVGEFDLVLLGLGDDGHTASLFPGHDWGSATGAPDVLSVLDAPKPPAQRVTLSAARLSRAREVLFMVEGVAKRNAVARWHAGESLPATAIKPVGGVDVLLESVLLELSVV